MVTLRRNKKAMCVFSHKSFVLCYSEMECSGMSQKYLNKCHKNMGADTIREFAGSPSLTVCDTAT